MNHTYAERFHSELLNVAVWFTDHSLRPLGIECKRNLTLPINDRDI